MCGRYSLYSSANDIADYFNLREHTLKLDMSYNIAPTEQCPIILPNANDKQLLKAIWGIKPKWRNKAPLLINTRIETICEKKFFFDIFKKNRCIIPANGFFEWRAENNQKQPYYFSSEKDKILAFAGIFNYTDGVYYFSILTKEADVNVKSFHSRMPAILNTDSFDSFFSDIEDTNALLSDIKAHDTPLKVYAVSKSVNSACHKSSDLIVPLNSA